MFGVVAGLGEVGVGIFQDWILIAMAELAFEGGVAVVMVVFVVHCAFGAVGVIVRNLRHINLQA